MSPTVRLRLTRVPGQHGGVRTWQVVGQPFRVVVLPRGWMVVALGDDARAVLARHDVLGRRFRTRIAAVGALRSALGSASAGERAAAERPARVVSEP